MTPNSRRYSLDGFKVPWRMLLNDYNHESKLAQFRDHEDCSWGLVWVIDIKYREEEFVDTRVSSLKSTLNEK